MLGLHKYTIVPIIHTSNICERRNNLLVGLGLLVFAGSWTGEGGGGQSVGRVIHPHPMAHIVYFIHVH